MRGGATPFARRNGRNRQPRDRRRARAAIALAAAMLVAACGSTTPPTPGVVPTPVRVVATTTVFADLVHQVGGDRVSVASLVPPGVDVHTFDPTPADAVRVSRARLAVMNGLGLDDWLGRLLVEAGAGGLPVVRLAVDLPGVTYLTGSPEPGTTARSPAPGADRSPSPNPHLWLNAAYAARYAGRIATALAQVDPSNAAGYAERAAAYARQLMELDAWIRATFAAIPEGNRRIVTYHDAFPYFAAAYGLTVVGNIVPSPGQEPSAGEIAALVDEIRAGGAQVVLAEAQFNPALARTVARETGATVVDDLYTGALGAPPADTYAGMLRWDVERLKAALS